jgi:hypothetical protein
MPKRPLSFKVRIPPYRYPRTAWRQDLHAILQEAVSKRGIVYSAVDKLELKVVLYLKDNALIVHDVDNRLKDIMDALQGRAGGKKGKSKLKPIIPNDNQVFRVTIEKMAPHKQSLGMGHLVVRKFRA